MVLAFFPNASFSLTVGLTTYLLTSTISGSRVFSCDLFTYLVTETVLF